MKTIFPLSEALVVLARLSRPEIVSRLSTSALTFGLAGPARREQGHLLAAETAFLGAMAPHDFQLVQLARLQQGDALVDPRRGIGHIVGIEDDPASPRQFASLV